MGIHDRVELSTSRWSFKLSDVVPGRSLDMGVIGAKVKVAGDMLYDQDRSIPAMPATSRCMPPPPSCGWGQLSF